MATFIPKRRSRGAWITQALADHADVRSLWDGICFLLCGVAFVGLGFAALYIAGAWAITKASGATP